nr:uncharacterized protein LOC122322052 [Drosophila bipectinata]
MLGYEGSAKERLEEIRNLNSDAHLEYRGSVKPIFEWCISDNSTFRTYIPFIKNITTYHAHEKEIIWKIISETINKGLLKADESLEKLKKVQNTTARLSNVFNETHHNVTYDFGPKGYYGELKVDLKGKKTDLKTRIKKSEILHTFKMIGAAIFTFGLLIPNVKRKYKIATEAAWNQEKEYDKQLELIEYTFEVLKEKIAEASSIITDINKNLDADRTNLHILRGKIDSAKTTNIVLRSNIAALTRTFASSLLDLTDQCTKYVNWHGYERQFVENNIVRSRREAERILEVQGPEPFISYLNYGSRTSAPESVLELNNLKTNRRFPEESIRRFVGSPSYPLLKW